MREWKSGFHLLQFCCKACVYCLHFVFMMIAMKPRTHATFYWSFLGSKHAMIKRGCNWCFIHHNEFAIAILVLINTTLTCRIWEEISRQTCSSTAIQNWPFCSRWGSTLMYVGASSTCKPAKPQDIKTHLSFDLLLPYTVQKPRLPPPRVPDTPNSEILARFDGNRRMAESNIMPGALSSIASHISGRRNFAARR